MDKSIIKVNKKCCGCGLCVQECPFNAISMKENEEGFLYPVVDKELCINCGKCLSICPANKTEKIAKEKEQHKAYMVINKNYEEYKLSASGGFATVLSRYVIQEYNGIVYGATLDENHNVKHIEVDNINQLSLLQGSKYVQSNLDEVYKSIKNNLKERKVLFIGTPCQVDAIKRYVKDDANLITCDLVCHGVASPGYFIKYLKFLEEKYGKKIKNFRFRNKCNYDKCGFVEKIIFSSKKTKKIIAEEDSFYADFIKEKNYRYSCYNCQYKNLNRQGDFTLGDVASWEEYYDFFPEKATSLVIVNKTKAEILLKKLNNDIYIREISLEKEKKLNTALNKQVPMDEERMKLYERYEDFFKYEQELLNSISKKEKIKTLTKKILPFSVRIKIRKMQRGKKNG